MIVLALIMLPGLWVKPRPGTFFLAGRSAGSWAVAASLLATCLGASAVVGLVGLAAGSSGWSAFWWLGSGAAGLVLLGLVWARPMRRSPAVRTLPQWLGETYGTPARVLAAGLIDAMWIAVIAAQWTAAGTVLNALLGVGLSTGIILTACATTMYTTWGGQASVLRTDRWQVVLIAAALVLLVVALGPMPARTTGNATPGPQASSLFNWLALVTVVGGMYVVGPDMCSRILVARSDRAARNGALLAAAGLFIVALAIVAIGSHIRRAGLTPEPARDALPWLINRSGRIPLWLGATVNIGLLAAMVSSADTCLLTAASVFELDIIGRGETDETQEHMGRLATAAAGMLSAVIAVTRPGIIPNMLLAYAFYAGGLLIPLLLLARPTLATALPRAGVWVAMALGGTVPVVLKLSGTVAAMASAGFCGVLVCLAILAGVYYMDSRRRSTRS